MRLSQVRHILSEVIHDLKVTIAPISNSPNATVSDFRQAISAAKAIRETGLFKDKVADLLNCEEIALSASDTIVVHGNRASSFATALTALDLRARIFLEGLQEFLGEDQPHYISIKLPETKDIDKVAKTLTTVKLALEQSLVNPSIDGHVELISFERGSNWIEIGLGSMVAYNFLSSMMQLIYASRNKELEIEAKREMIRAIKMQNDVKEKVMNAIDKELEDYFSESIDSLVKDAKIDASEPEYRNRLAHSLRLLSDLTSEGLEVHPSLITSNESAGKFPDPKKLVEALKALPAEFRGCNNDNSGVDTVPPDTV